MKYLLDTDTVSFAIRDVGNVIAKVREHRPSEIGISAVTLAALRYGADRKGSRRLHESIDAFIRDVEVAAFDEDAAAEFGRLGTLLAERGTPIGEMDTMIAAHAVSLKARLVTNNARHFTRVPGLVVESWK